MGSLFRILETAFFLGLVIFVHELGHFLAARWCGVLVERFSIGFGPVLFAFRRGDTEYAISAIPLGGYVKMLGQSDTPTVEQPSEDPRSYQNKTVGQRMLIISAGVVMNLLMALVCFAIAYSIGVPYQPAHVGAVMPGRPAWIAGLQAGDRIVEVNGHGRPSYEMLLNQVMLTNPAKQPVEMTIERGSERLNLSIFPERRAGDLKPTIGLVPSLGLDLGSSQPPVPFPPVYPRSKSAMADKPRFEVDDRVVAVEGQDVDTYQVFDRAMFDHRQSPVRISVQRANGGVTEVVTVEPAHVRTLGLRMAMGPISAVRADSPAAKAVDNEGNVKPIESGDRIIGVDGVVDFDPMKLADVFVEKAGQRVEVTLRRKARSQEEVKVYVVPEKVPTWNDFPHPSSVLADVDAGIPSLGIAYRVGRVVHAVEPNSPAAGSEKAIQTGDIIKKVTFNALVPKSMASSSNSGWFSSAWNWVAKRFFGKVEEKITVEREPHDREDLVLNPESVACGENGWPGIFWGLQASSVRSVTLSIERPASEPNVAASNIEVTLTPEADPSWPLHLRGLAFREERSIQQGATVLESIGLGFDYTWVTMTRVYMTLRGLVLQTLSPQLLSGPVRLAYVAYQVTQDFTILVLFIGLINVNLAVVNFLPIPVLDGGHMVFLLYEGIFRRRPNERLVLASHIFGLFCIIALMSFVIYLDIRHLLGL